MSYRNLVNAQQTLARRKFLQLLAGTTVGGALAACVPITAPGQSPVTAKPQETGALKLEKISIDGVEFHYVEQGQGDPIVLLHGGLADYREWGPQMARFSQTNRVIAYSQRYSYPNQNLPIVDDYTTLVDAQDLVAILHAFDLENSQIVGYSSGAFMALAMALEHPELVRTLVLAEPPILHWATGLPGGDALLSEFMTTFWKPVGEAFRQGDKELALRISVTHFIGADVLDELPTEVRQGWEDNLGAWEAFTTSHDTFPMIDKERVSQLQIPTLSLTAERTSPLQQLVNDELDRLLPLGTRETIRDVSHEMWAEQPEVCGAVVYRFLQEQA